MLAWRSLLECLNMVGSTNRCYPLTSGRWRRGQMFRWPRDLGTSRCGSDGDGIWQKKQIWWHQKSPFFPLSFFLSCLKSPPTKLGKPGRQGKMEDGTDINTEEKGRNGRMEDWSMALTVVTVQHKPLPGAVTSKLT